MILPKQSAEELFARALELEPADRPAFLDQACRGDGALRLLVEELLREDERAGSFLRQPIVGGMAEPTASFASRSGPGDDALPPRFPVGETIAQRFRVVRFIARGGMGEVYEVEDHLLHGNRVALKVVLPEIAADEGAAHRFEQEVLLARKINHPNLCPIYDIFRCEEPAPFLFLTMKLLAGETLEASLRRHVLLPREEALEVFRQMVAGIAAIHGAGVVHRDIKPTNVMLDRSDLRLHVSIMDFGLARLNASEATRLRPDMVAGTPGYLAAELLRGHRPSRATDIFALGVVLHQVLTGERPRESADGMQLEPTPALNRASVPAACIQAVRDFLAEDPVVRVRAFDQVRNRLDTGSGMHLLEPRRTPHLWTRRQMLVGSGAACAALAGGAWWNRDSISEYLHPLPLKRFVALVGWPPSGDAKLRPMLTSLIDAISSELSRAEAYDHNLFLIPHFGSEVSTTAQLDDVRESLGANLVLAASAVQSKKNLHVSLEVLPPASSKALRSKEIRVAENEQLSLGKRAVRAAADLLDIRHYELDGRGTEIGTDNAAAYASFQIAESLVRQANDSGLQQAIGKYKEAIDLDGRYALAYAKLAHAYARLADVEHDPAAIVLAVANADKSLRLNSRLVAGHVARSIALQEEGDLQRARQDLQEALELDPANTRTVIYEAQLATRMNRWSEGEDAFHRALQQRPNDWLAHNEFGVLLQAQGKYVQAGSEFRAAHLANPKFARALNNIAAIDLNRRRVSEAISALKECLSLHADSLAASNMSLALRSQGRLTDALRYAEQATQFDPSDAGAWLELGDCRTMGGKHAQQARVAYLTAAKVQREGLEVDSNDGPGWILLGLCGAKTGRMEESIGALRKGDALPSGDLDTQVIKARALELLKDRDGALATLAACLVRGASTFDLDLAPDMASLRQDARYQSLVGHLEKS